MKGIFSIFRRKKAQKKLKYKLTIEQKQKKLLFKGEFAKPNYFAKELWLVSRDNSYAFKADQISLTTNFKFNVDLENLLHTIRNEENQFFDWYIKVSRPVEDVNEKLLENENVKIVSVGNEDHAEYLIRLGRFQNTYINSLDFFSYEGIKAINYITKKGNISLGLEVEPVITIGSQIDIVKSKKSLLKVEGQVFSRNSRIIEGDVILKGRNNEGIATVPLYLDFQEKQTQLKFGLNRYKYKFDIDIEQINNGQLLIEDTYDVFLSVKTHDSENPVLIRVGKPAFRARYFLKETSGRNKEKAIFVNPYYTFKLSNLSLEVFEYPIESYKYLKKAMRWSWFYKMLNRKRDIWLIGERTYKAQDTGFSFFKYMRTHHPEKEVYYVIDENSPEKKNVDPYGNVLRYKSKEHIWHALNATRIISSHHPDYLYPVRTPKFKKKVKALKVFLQHGVMGTKNMTANYGKKASGFDTDIFLVSSQFEKEMIINDFGYNADEVFVTGLSRFDELFAKDVEDKRQLVIIPTWRDWIGSEETFLTSEYFSRYDELIHHPRLHELSKKYNFNIVFCLHPNMQKFTHYFKDAPVKCISQGEVDVQRLIKESAIMLTDYSSVGFDFSFLYKPIVYYQFDRNRFIGKRPSHLDLDNDLPGEIAFELEDVLQLLEKYAQTNFEMEPQYIKRANKFIQHRDRSSSERVYKVINDSKIKKNRFAKIKDNLLVQKIFERFRKSKYYFPTMRLFYNTIRSIIPVDNRLILFESGVGKQYADSPRYIYEEIVEKGLNYKKVWVYNKNTRFKDPDTKRIKRLSPQYFYYLAKAGYWVNNQNFPFYIKKRPETTFIQTWHGTPLKKMLFDIENVQGRNEDYIDRVAAAIKNWDYLISPSRYATEAFRSAFRYQGKVVETGYPRNDLFYRSDKEEIASSVKRRLNLPKDKKVILYAPTFRDNQTTGKNKFIFDINLDLEKMKERLGDEYVVLLRMHVVISNKLMIKDELKDFVFNCSSYPEIQELFLISDTLITDYSSVMFDFANSDKPILFYTFDFEEYRDNIRGFYMDFESEAPGPLLKETEEVIQAIENIDKINEDYRFKYSNFKNKYCELEDGNATKRVVERLIES